MQRETGKRLAGGTPKNEKKPKKPSRLTRQQKVLVAVAVVLAVALVAVVACQSLFVRPDLEKKPSKAEEQEQIDYGETTPPKADGERKSEDYYTVLILGRDTGGGGNTDTILLASYDVTNQKATVMSIPRDTMVNVSWDLKKINSVYNMYGGGEKGIQHLYKEIAQLVGFEPDYQVVVEWEAVGEIVDAMGGVYFDVPRNMNYDDPTQDLHIHINKGYQLLNGEQAMGVIRYRHDNRVNGKTLGYPDGDIGRIATQQAFLKAVVEQLLKVQNVTKINQFVKVFQDNVETDMSFTNILWFAQQAVFGGLSVENVNFVTMPGNYNATAYSYEVSKQIGKNNWQSYVTPNADELLELVNNHLSPFKEEFTLADLDIMSVNKDGSLSSTTGHVEDTRAAKPPQLLFSKNPEAEKPAEEPAADGEDPVVSTEPSNPGSGGTVVIDPTPPPAETTDPTPDPEPTEPTEPPTEPVDPTPAEPQPEEPQDPGFSIIEPPPAV